MNLASQYSLQREGSSGALPDRGGRACPTRWLPAIARSGISSAVDAFPRSTRAPVLCSPVIAGERPGLGGVRLHGRLRAGQSDALVRRVDASTPPLTPSDEAGLLRYLIANDADYQTALTKLGELYAGAPSERFRSDNVGVAGHIFPHPLRVPALIDALLQRMSNLWLDCANPIDDVYVASFGIIDLLSIHPFANGNGRVALGWAQYLLMTRWGVDAPPATFPPEAQRRLHGLFAADEVCDGASVEAMEGLNERLASWISRSSLMALRADLKVSAMAFFLHQSINSTCNRQR